MPPIHRTDPVVTKMGRGTDATETVETSAPIQILEVWVKHEIFLPHQAYYLSKMPQGSTATNCSGVDITFPCKPNILGGQ